MIVRMIIDPYQYLKMEKDDIIKSLCMQNEYLKSERDKWQERYNDLLQKYNQLLESTKNGDNITKIIKKHEESSPQLNHGLKLKHVDTQLFDFQTPLVTTQASPTTQPQKGETGLGMKRSKSQQETNIFDSMKVESKQMVRKTTVDEFDFFSKQQIKPPELDKMVCELIEGCFIIEKNSSIDHFDPVRLMHPMAKYINLKSMFDIIYRYIFVNDQLFLIEDDEFDSRKNQIMFGTPAEEFQFIFDNLSESKEGEKGRLNNFEKQTNLMRKRYVYGIVIPEILQHQNKFYETEVAYGFLSHVPFPNFFKDLNRIVQQQVKFKMLNMHKNSILKSQKLEIIQQTITHITNRSLQRQLIIKNYPINLELKANICGLKLVYTNKNSYISDQLLNVEHLIQKYSLEKIFKLLHYVLAQHSVIIVCKNRKKLNRVFEIIRNLLYPFNWIFPIIYFYSPFFEPFLSSPLPILVGHIENKNPGDEEDENSFNDQKLPQHQFAKIYVEDAEAKDQNEIQAFSKRIKHNYKKLFKDKRSKSPWKPFGGSGDKDKSLTHLSEKPLAQRTTTKIFEYVKKLKMFVQTGKISQQMDDFLIQFMDTQMVSYYKENIKPQSNKKMM